MSGKYRKSRVIITAIFATCAIVFVVLAGITIYKRYFESQEIPGTTERESKKYKLPEAKEPYAQSNDSVEIKIPQKVRAFPVVAGYSTITNILGEDVIFMPILMNDSKISVNMKPVIVDPMRWREYDSVNNSVLGRKSIWYMDIGSYLLYGIILEFNSYENKPGVGFVVVKRIDERIYDILLEDYESNVLAAGRGRLVKINPNIGRGRMEIIDSQESVRNKYDIRWPNIDPSLLPLLGR